jgi:hypothetical protein
MSEPHKFITIEQLHDLSRLRDEKAVLCKEVTVDETKLLSARSKGWRHPNPKPERVIEHRGIRRTIREWAEFCGTTKATIQGWERRNYIGELLDHKLRQNGELP